MAHKKVLLISPTEIISQSPIQDNIDEKILAKTLSTVQETGLRQILGTTLYSGLTDAVYFNIVSGTTIPQLYSDLLSVSKPYLIAKTTSDFLIFNQYKITNKGVLKLNDNTANNLSEGDLQAVKDYFDNLISTYKQDVIDFLSEANLIDRENDIQIGSEASGWYLGVPVDICEVPNESPVINVDDYITLPVGSFTYSQIGELRNVLLISGEEIISQSVIQDNVDVKLLAKTISLVQDVYLKDILTPTLYFGLLDATNKFIQSGTTIPQLYVDLTLFVKPYLINKTVAEFLVPNEYKVTSKGILKLSDTTAVPIVEADLQAVKDYYDNISTTYKRSLLEFLNDNDLVGGCNNDSTITSDATGWYLGNDYLVGIDMIPISSGGGSGGSGSTITSITFVGDVLTINTTTSSYPVTINNFSSLTATTFYGDGSNLTGINTSSGDYLPLSGGTVSGNTIFQSGVTGNTLTSVLDGSFNGIRIGKGRNETSNLFNLGIGNQTFNTGTTGQQNTAVGYFSLRNLTGGSFNSAYGLYSMNDSISSSNNTAIGYESLRYNNGSQNTAIGFQSLQNEGQSTGNTATYNTANGYRAGRFISSGSFNTIFGATAMLNQTTGSGNTVGGYAALGGDVNSSSTDNVALGYAALRLNSSGSGNVALGYGAGENELGSNKLYIHNNNSSTPLIGGDFSTGEVIINSGLTVTGLSGATNRMVIADTNGKLSTQDIPTGGGGGTLYYLNLSNEQTPYREFSPIPTTAAQQTTGVTMNGNSFATIAQFLTPTNYPNTALIPAGFWSFYLHALKSTNNSNFNIFCEVYIRTTGGTETLILTTDPVIIESTSAVMYLTDGFYSGSSINFNDRILVKVRAENTGNQTHTVTLLTEGSQHYSHAIIPISSSPTTLNGSGTPNEIAYWVSATTIGSLSTGTYPSLTELTYVKDVTSPIQTQLNTKISSFNNINILAYQALGSTIKGATLDLGLNRALTTVSHGTSGRFQLTPIYIPVATTITGVKFMSAVQGVYTASTYNGIGFYSYSGGVGTLLANTADDPTMWKQNANVLVSRNFTGSTPGPVTVAAGLYYIGSVVNGNTAQVGSTAPQILGTASMATSMTTYDFTNSARLVTHIVSITTSPTTWNMSSGLANGAIYWFGLF
jgi:hypothetical protein